MNIAVVPPVLAIALPLLAPLINKISADRLPPLLNAIIAAALFAAAVVAWVIFAGSLTHDPYQDAALFVGYLGALIVDPTMKPLYGIIVEAVSVKPLVAPPPPVLRASAQRSSAATAPMPTPPMHVEVVKKDDEGTQS